MGILTWVLGGGAFNLFETYALHIEFREFIGGPQGLAASVMPALEAMRPLRWPAERIDTLGGYLTYHNLLLFQGFLAIYAAVQGVHLIRRPESQGSLEQVLATGWSPSAYLRDRLLGLLATLTIITLGLGASVAIALAYVGAPDTIAAFQSLLAVGLCSLVGMALGLLCAQVWRSARTALGVTVITLVALYVGTNEWENLGWAGALRFLSPFHWANDGRALVPGVGFNLRSMAVLLAMAMVLLWPARWAFLQRDYAGALLRERPPSSRRVERVRVQRWALSRPWRALLVRHRIALLAWALTTAAFSVLWMGLAGAVTDSWSMSEFFRSVLGSDLEGSMRELYVSFGCDTLAAIVVAYSVSQASGWVLDLQEGRVETMLSAPLSWPRLVMERLAATLVGVLAVTASWLLAAQVMAPVVDVPVDAAGQGRALVLCLGIGGAAAALAAILTALTRNAVATSGLIAYVVVAYVLGWFVDILHWPSWLRRLSVFEAFEHPYLEWPSTTNLVILAATTVLGATVAAVIAQRTAKVAG